MSHTNAQCVLLADRHVALSDGVRGLLGTMFDAVVMVADVAALLETMGRLRPIVLVADISLAGTANLDWLRRLREESPETRIVLLSLHDQPRVFSAAREAGADAVILKSCIATDLLPTLDQMIHPASAPAGIPNQP